MTLKEVADTLHVTPRSARRYLEELGSAVEKVPTGTRTPRWRLCASHRPRAIKLRPMQVYSLLAAQRVFDLLRGSALYDEIDLARRDLIGLTQAPRRASGPQPIGTALEQRFVYVPHAPAEYPDQGEDIDIILHALVEQRAITCHLRSLSGKHTRITIEPYALAIHQDALYLAGRQVNEDQVMVFALHALSDVQVVEGSRFEIPRSFSLEACLPQAFGVHQAVRKVRVVIDFDAHAAQSVRARRFSPTQRRSNLRGGGVRLTMAVGDLSEVARWVLGFGDHARVIEPEALRDRVIRELRGALALYRERKV